MYKLQVISVTELNGIDVDYINKIVES